MNSAHLYKVIITTKSKEALDGEDIAKVNRFYRDTKKYYLDKESLFKDLYFKFIRRYELEINEAVLNLN